MFAMVAFCTATFVILALVANSLSNARRLQRPMVDAGVVASWLAQTNLVEGVYRINLGELLGDTYNGYTCTYDIEEVRTNKLFQVDFIIQNDHSEFGANPVVSKMSIQFYSPNSPAGSMDPGGMGRR